MTVELVVLRDDEADPGAQGRDGEWQGPLAWQRRRGETLVSYFRGVARRAAPVVSPDGTSTTAARVLPGLQSDADEATAWAVVSPPETRTLGELVFVAGGPARFVPDAEREFYVSSFELTLAGSIDVALAVSDLDFARALCGALGDMVWLGPAGARFDCSLIGAAAVVAALRGRREPLKEFCAGVEARVVRADVSAALAPLGWRPRTAADRAADAARLKDLLMEWIARPVRHVPPWFDAWACVTFVACNTPLEGPPPSSRDELQVWLAKSARVSEQEYVLAWELDDDRHAKALGSRVVPDEP